MGVMRFLVQPETLLQDWPEAQRAYLCGVDSTVWPTRVEVAGNQFLCRRPVSDSGKMHVGWSVEGFGRPVTSTASLPERADFYLLPVELARGKLVQVRNQLASWTALGVTPTDAFRAVYREAHLLFARAATTQGNSLESCQSAQLSLEKSFCASELLTGIYTEQRIAARHRQYPQLPTALGCCLADGMPRDNWSEHFPSAFNAACVPLEWRTIEPEEGDYHWDVYDAQVDWCERNALMVRGGPLIDLAPGGLPAWLAPWGSDFLNLQSFVCDFIESVVSRYVGRIRLWEVAARANTGGALELTEENRLQLVAKVLEVARQVDTNGQFVVRIEQPWGEYQARGHHRLSPMQFTDALIRAGLLSAIHLEVAVGFAPRSSPSRDMIDFSRMIDQWTSLGLPLQVTLVYPSSDAPDPQVSTDLTVAPWLWKQPYCEQSQADWAEQHLRLLMAKPAVVGIFWGQFDDGQRHRFPNAGLLRPDGTPKRALQTISRYRQKYWK